MGNWNGTTPTLSAILTRRFRAALPVFDPPGRAWRTRWNLPIRPCDEGPHVVLNYLTRYVRSGPLHEAKILRADDEVAFRYLDHRTGKVEVLPCKPARGSSPATCSMPCRTASTASATTASSLPAAAATCMPCRSP